MKLNGMSVVVTGASSGMGKAIVERFAKEGANIIAVARRKERLDELAAALKEMPGRVIPFVGDVSKQETMESAIDLAVKEFGRLDVLINNAGIMDDMSPIGDVRNEKIDQVFAVNVYGPMYSMRKAVQVFLEQGDGGNIINVASLGAMRTAAGAIYCASKAAVVSMTKEFSFESNKPNRQVELMRCKHCIKYALNMCKSPKSLVLRDEKGKAYPLKFDCKKCEMSVLSPN